MKKALLFAMLLAVLALGALSAQIREIYSQPYPVDADGMPSTDQAYTSTLATAHNVDYRYADNFSGLTEPITKITVYGVSSLWNDDWFAADPAATEPFHVRFYNYVAVWTQPPQPLIAEVTGTYTVNLYDSFGDGWDGSLLDVLVNGVVVLNDITLSDGEGPEDYTFFANAGDEITTIFTAGQYPFENSYEILDPDNAVIATDGEGNSVPTGLNIPQPLIAPETGTYTVNLYDSYGDGWNGGRLDVLVNGVVVWDDITLSEGEGPEAYTFFANAGDEIITIFVPGSCPDENSYQIHDPNNVVIATDGEGNNVPTGFNIPQPLIAPETGTYTVNLYDDYGDGWDAGSLDVLVNGIVVLNNITLSGGAGPEAYTFTANTGDEITTLFIAGSYANENWYEILDPSGVVIATDGPDPQGIGFVPTYEVDEPDWNNPAHEYLALDVTTTYIGPTNLIGDPEFYQYDIILPEPVNMAEGWVSVQASIDDGATTWFLWSVCDADYGDGSSWQYAAAKSRDTSNTAYVANGNDRGQKFNDMAFRLYTDDGIIVPGPESTLGGTLPDELQGTDAIIYTVESTGIRNVTVLKPAEFTGEWYCWLQDIVGLRAAANPIPADTESWTFYEVLFEAKAPVTVVIDERDLNTVPVELSSFTATITAQNYVKLAWTSQSESNIMGYNLYRNESLDLSAAIKITDLIAGTNTSEAHTYTYLDRELEQTGTYYYWLQVSDLDGSSIYHGPINVVFSQGEEGGTPDIPFVTKLENAYPNPFNPNTNIRYQLEKPGDVKIDIYNARGQLVRSFSSYHAAAGYYQINWDGRDSSGKAVSSGVYQYKMTSGKYHSTKKMVLKK